MNTATLPQSTRDTMIELIQIQIGIGRLRKIDSKQMDQLQDILRRLNSNEPLAISQVIMINKIVDQVDGSGVFG